MNRRDARYFAGRLSQDSGRLTLAVWPVAEVLVQPSLRGELAQRLLLRVGTFREFPVHSHTAPETKTDGRRLFGLTRMKVPLLLERD